MGVWIEIYMGFSMPGAADVTPFMGVWIEMTPQPVVLPSLCRHSLYGSVD